MEKTASNQTTDEVLNMFNGNDQPTVKGLPKIVILGGMNDVALAHLEKNTGLKFEKSWNSLQAQPTSSNQIVRLFLSYNYKTQYHNNMQNENTLFLKSDHHIGFKLDSVCVQCLERNGIHAKDMERDEYLAC
jgi:hypothetical protein